MKPTKNKFTKLVSKIRQLVEQARQNISRKINTELLITYWSVGKLIVLREKEESIDEKSSRQLILELSKELSLHVGKGFSRSNLFAMRQFYLLYKLVQTASGHQPVESVQASSGQKKIKPIAKGKTKLAKHADMENIGKTISFQLSWSHYCELIKIDSDLERSFYQQQSINENWSVRELQRQKDTALFERIALSKDHKRRYDTCTKRTNSRNGSGYCARPIRFRVFKYHGKTSLHRKTFRAENH